MNIWLAEIWQAWRASLRHPGFLILATGVLALGIGASVAVFSLLENTLLKPLPVAQPSQLMVVGRWRNGHIGTISPRYYQHLGKLEGVASIGLKQAGSMANIAGGGAPEQVPRIYANRYLLPTLGVQPILGRNFNVQEDSTGGSMAVLLSYGFWQRRYGADPNVIGRRLKVEGVERTIIGVLPASFSAVAGSGDIVMPMALPTVSGDDGANYMAIARLAKGASKKAVASQIDGRLHALDEAASNDGNTMPRMRYGAESLADWVHRGARPVLILFQASALLVLLIALVNLANLMLLRSLSRSHDAAVRNALGASFSRLMLPALGEGLLIGLLGVFLGMAIAKTGLLMLQGFVPARWLMGGSVRVGVSAWLLALAIGLLAALLASGFALRRSRSATSLEALREGGRGSDGRNAGRLGRVLVVAQVALATVLLSAAGLFVHALYDASQMPLGFDGDQVLTFELAPVAKDFPDTSAVEDLAKRLTERLRTIPGVSDAAVTTNLPTSTDSIGSFGQFMNAVHVPGGTTFAVQYHGVGPDFFKLFSIPLQEGRYFTRNDARGGERVAIISHDMAETRYEGHALGEYLDVEGRDNAVWRTRIVGVVGDTWQHGPLQPKQPVLYVPLAQMPAPMLAIFRHFEPLRFVLHGRGNPNTWRADVRAAVNEIAPDQPIANLRTMRSIVHATTSDARLNLLLIGVFATLALLLAAAGLYAVMAVAVTAREREFGVRTALGASPSLLVRLVLRGGLLQVSLGLMVGVAFAVAVGNTLSNLLADLLGQHHAVDPVAMVSVCLILAAAGLAACLIPALRAARVQPMHALRGE